MQVCSSCIRQPWLPITEENLRQCKSVLVEVHWWSEHRVLVEMKWLPFWGFSLSDHFADSSKQSAISSAHVCYCRLRGIVFTRVTHYKWLSVGLPSFPTIALSFPLWIVSLLLKSSRKMCAQLNRLVSVPFNKLPYQALKSVYDVKHFIEELC